MMRHLCALITAMALWVGPVFAQELNAIARVDIEQTGIEKGWFGQETLTLTLSQGVPFRVFTLDEPRRLVIDFREVDFSGVRGTDFLTEDTAIEAVRFGRFQPGWSRFVADLAAPMIPDEIDMRTQEDAGTARLSVRLKPADATSFAAAAGAPDGVLWPAALPTVPKAPVDDDRFVVVLDPGHGGVDPGAEREGVTEKELMLNIARAMQDAMLRAGDVDVVLTREEDIFVSLQSRVAIAHQAGADLFVSLHADALSQGGAQGATVYTLSDEASDAATAHLAARHNRADIIAGADLTGSDDEVASVLLDLARQETTPRSLALAESLIEGMDRAGGPMNRRPLRKAGFSVLKSADIPSVLVEVGFLSSKRDLDNLRDPVWRALMIDGMVEGILQWRDSDAALRPLVRQ